ncbi:cysteine methyltransferase [Solibacillus sp. FSL H8-0538]|uniref:cysteine methyltransferase n=1 Tax=Solibacillus sp. FSL H8-0538 TaxID=2921400 RepID=UPI0030F8454A
MAHENNPLSDLYLAVDEHMQLHLACYSMIDYDEAFGFLIRTTGLIVTEDFYAREIPIELVVSLNKDGSGISSEAKLLNKVNVKPLQFTKIIECIQASPAYAEIILHRLDEMQRHSEGERFEQINLATQYFLSTLPDGITHFTTNMAPKKLVWIYKQDKLISNVSPFTVDEQGGHLCFEVQAGFTNGLMLQCYRLECMMHLFTNEEKLGYYFELFLDEDDFHHQQMYRELPEKFMHNKRFLNRILQLMRTCDSAQYEHYLKDLIEKFKAAI